MKNKLMFSIKKEDVKKLLELAPDSNIYHSLSKYRSDNPIKRIIFERYLRYMSGIINGIESIIDIGCGEGILLYLANKLGRSEKLVGIDLSTESLKIAKQISNADFIRADIHHIPIKDSVFCLSFCLSVFEHIDRHEEAVEEITRVSKKSVITIPRPMLFRVISVISLRNLTRFGREKNHVKEFKKSELLEILPEKSTVERRSFWYVAKI